MKLIEEAENEPYKALKPRRPTFPRDIPMETWTVHFEQILRSRDTRPRPDPGNEENTEFINRFSRQDMQKIITSLKCKKACGLDMIYNEHLKKAAPILAGAWTELFNECVQQGRIPER